MKKKSITISLIALMVALMLPNFAQSQESDFGNWVIYIGNKKLDEGGMFTMKFNIEITMLLVI